MKNNKFTEKKNPCKYIILENFYFPTDAHYYKSKKKKY